MHYFVCGYFWEIYQCLIYLQFHSLLLLTIIHCRNIYSLHFSQFSSVVQSCLTLCEPMDCSTTGFPVLTNSQSLLKLMSIESVIPSISSSVVPFSSCPQSFPASGSFPMSQFLTSGGQSIAASALVLPFLLVFHALFYHWCILGILPVWDSYNTTMNIMHTYPFIYMCIHFPSVYIPESSTVNCMVWKFGR